MSNANCARLSPFEAASSISLKSELTPDIPKTGDTSKTNLLFYILVASGGLAIFSFSKKAKKKIIE